MTTSSPPKAVTQCIQIITAPARRSTENAKILATKIRRRQKQIERLKAEVAGLEVVLGEKK